jgi:ankyrin repeat protein
MDALIDAGIDVNNQNRYGATCLMCACLRGRATVVARLLSAGASLAPQLQNGLTVLDMATTTDCSELLDKARDVGETTRM